MTRATTALMMGAAAHMTAEPLGAGVVGVPAGLGVVPDGEGVGVSVKAGPPKVPVPPNSANLAAVKHFNQLVLPSAVVNSESMALFAAPTVKTTVMVSSLFLLTEMIQVG